jgi:hypothetical protein
VIADFVHPARRLRFRRFRAFIASRGDLSYCVVPAGTPCPSGTILNGYYGERLFEDGDYSTEIHLPVTGGDHLLRSDLTETLLLLSVLADAPDWSARLGSVGRKRATRRSWTHSGTTARPSAARL